MSYSLDDLASFMPRMPTKEELRQRSIDWRNVIGPLLIDRWPHQLLAESMPTIFLPFPLILGKQWWADEQSGWSSEAEKFARKIDKACGWERKFFRLNSRSPKDAADSLISCSGREMLHVMRASERTLEDYCKFEHADVEPVLCLRDDWFLNPSEELRVFVKGGRVKAVAEYGHKPVWRWELSRDAQWRLEVERYVLHKLGPHLPLDTIVVDVCVRPSGELKLIEINPYGLSDPVGAVSYARIEEGIPGIARHRPTTPQAQDSADIPE